MPPNYGSQQDTEKLSNHWHDEDVLKLIFVLLYIILSRKGTRQP